MKYASLTLIGLLATYGLVQAKTGSQFDTKGTIEKLLMNPEGDVDGFLLNDGTQINFPPHMSAKLTAVVNVKDKVEVKGERENDKVVRADTVTNVKTGASVADAPPAPPEGGPGLLPPPPPGGPGPGPHGPPRLAGLQQLSVEGRVQKQLYGRRGEVNGVVLDDGSIVHFGPRVMEDSKIKTDAGQALRASGFGTKNANGQSIEATELKN